MVVHDNTASAAAGGLSVALAGFGQFDLRHGQVYGNHAYEGGGVYLRGRRRLVRACEHRGHRDLFEHGGALSAGLENRAATPTSPVTLVRSRLHDNHATILGRRD